MHIDRFLSGVIILLLIIGIIFGSIFYLSLIYSNPIYALGLFILPACYFIGWLSEKFGIL